MNSRDRNLHEQLDISVLDPQVRRQVRANRGKQWSATADGIKELKDWFLEAQRYRCAYCQIPILSNRVGHCEFDHILPKEASARVNRKRARSNLQEDRRHTLGYKRFVYTLENLVVTCKLCNSCKGSFDSLRDRVRSPAKLPTEPIAYIWVHPHFHLYAQHIAIDQDWIYTSLTDEGASTVSACKLDEAETVSRSRQADALFAQSSDIDDFLIKYGTQFENIGARQGMCVLTQRFLIEPATAEAVVEVWATYSRKRGSEAMRRALDATTALLRR